MSAIEDKQTTPGEDLLWGASAIADFLGVSVDKIYYLIRKNADPKPPRTRSCRLPSSVARPLSLAERSCSALSPTPLLPDLRPSRTRRGLAASKQVHTQNSRNPRAGACPGKQTAPVSDPK